MTFQVTSSTSATHDGKIEHVLTCVKAKFRRIGQPCHDSNNFLTGMTVSRRPETGRLYQNATFD
jgi:hypothetical protein